MTTTINGLTGQSTTDPGDYFVLQNTAANRTRKITYNDLKSELAADMDIVTTAELSSAVAALTAAFQAADQAVLQAVFVIGSKIAVTTGAFVSTNPNTILGFGTWVKEEGKYYVGHKAGDTNFGTVNSSVGTLSHGHSNTSGSTTLNATQIPSHTHAYKDTIVTENSIVPVGTLGDGEAVEYRTPGIFSGFGTNGTDYDNDMFVYKNRTTSSLGGSLGHTHTINNDTHIPPSIVEVVWRRTA